MVLLPFCILVNGLRCFPDQSVDRPAQSFLLDSGNTCCTFVLERKTVMSKPAVPVVSSTNKSALDVPESTSLLCAARVRRTDIKACLVPNLPASLGNHQGKRHQVILLPRPPLSFLYGSHPKGGESLSNKSVFPFPGQTALPADSSPFH